MTKQETEISAHDKYWAARLRTPGLAPFTISQDAWAHRADIAATALATEKATVARLEAELKHRDLRIDGMISILIQVEGACEAMAEHGILAEGSWGYVTKAIKEQRKLVCKTLSAQPGGE